MDNCCKRTETFICNDYSLLSEKSYCKYYVNDGNNGACIYRSDYGRICKNIEAIIEAKNNSTK